MCGRFMLDSDVEEILRQYRILKSQVDDYKKGEVHPSENIPIVVSNNCRTLIPAKWGFTLDNTKELVINARSESIAEKSMFKDSFQNRRCIIPANLFYEWKEKENQKKTKHEIYIPDKSLISLGGIFKFTLNDEGDKELSFVIITTEANKYMKGIHSRMPLIIEDEALDCWLDNNTSSDVIDEIIKSNVSHQLKISSIDEDNKTFEQMTLF